jgi:anaerobic selenocysteine-containing dehydrogenase
MTTELASVCTLDCPDTCSLAVTVEDGQIQKVRGSDANPLTRGVVCNKVARYYPEFVHGPNRIVSPLKRSGPKGSGKFSPISWQQALDEIHQNFSEIIDEYGPQAIMPYNYAGPHGMLAGGSMDMRFFHKMGATLLHRRALCGGIKSEAYRGTFGTVPAAQPEQCLKSKLIVVWGNNVTFSNLHLAPLIKEARANGAKLVVIDPKRIKIAEQADIYLAVKPGMDIALAWGIANEIERLGGVKREFIDQHVLGFDDYMAEVRTMSLATSAQLSGIPDEQITAFAKLYMDTNPAILAVGNGLERNQNGGNGIRSIYALPAMAGKFGVEGGGIIGASGNLFPKDMKALQRPDLIPEGTRTLNILDIGQHLVEQDLDTPLKGLFIYNHNPVVVSPDQNLLKNGLSREDIFVVGCDVAMTDSMDYADIVLPACTHFEHNDIYCAYGQPYLQRAEPVIDPVGEALPNTEIFRRLAARFGYDDPMFKATDMELIDEAIKVDDRRINVRPSEIPTDQAISMETGQGATVLFGNVFPNTASGRMELKSSILKGQYNQEMPTYNPLEIKHPFTLITPSSNKMVTSTFGGVSANDDAPELEMHPDDASARGFKTGMTVKIFNELGEVFLPLKVTDEVRPGVLWSPKGSWFRTTPNGQTVSALAPTTKADLCEGACFNDCQVDVAAVS